ncbi:hypothetical protein [Bradyrhizobium sp. LMG 9283]|uniref:hypothetical protein n=1 Tax=Bradyrhizobium sp. LMG 9283 TaxID=592064 RepID=UPI0038907330
MKLKQVEIRWWQGRQKSIPEASLERHRGCPFRVRGNNQSLNQRCGGTFQSRKLIELAKNVNAVQHGGIHIEKINAPLLRKLKTGATEFRAGIKSGRTGLARPARERNLCAAAGKKRLAFRSGLYGPSLEVSPDRKTSWDRGVCRCLIGKRRFIPQNHPFGIQISECVQKKRSSPPGEELKLSSQ